MFGDTTPWNNVSFSDVQHRPGSGQSFGPEHTTPTFWSRIVDLSIPEAKRKLHCASTNSTDCNHSFRSFMCGCVEPRNQYRLKIPFRVVCVQVSSTSVLMNPNPRAGKNTRGASWRRLIVFLFSKIFRNQLVWCEWYDVSCFVLSFISHRNPLRIALNGVGRWYSTKIVRSTSSPFLSVSFIILLLTSSIYHIFSLCLYTFCPPECLSGVKVNAGHFFKSPNGCRIDGLVPNL